MRILLVGKEFKPITPRLFRVRVGLGEEEGLFFPRPIYLIGEGHLEGHLTEHLV